MDLNDSTKQDVQAISQITNQDPEKIMEQAVENFMAETGKQLIRQQAAQQQNQKASMMEQDAAVEELETEE